MKLIDNRLFIEFSEAVQCGIGTEKYLWKARSVGTKCYTFINDPSDNRRVLLEYESLKSEHKERVIARFGNPYDRVAAEPIRKMVVKDLQAEQFYLSYKYDQGFSLPIAVVESYTTAASWLNMLIQASADKRAIKEKLGLTVTDFWVKACELIAQDKVDLPTYIKRLQAKIKDYQQNSYASLIHKNYGKRNAAKIDDEVAESLLLELIAQPNAKDPAITRRYNKWATTAGKEQITESTVGKYRRKYLYLVSGEKYGSRPTYNTFGKHIARKRPSAPLLLVEHDDNELDLYFRSNTNKKGEARVYYFNRFVICVVIDAYNDYILGWSIAETYTKDLIRLAYLDAVYHIKELTGSWHLFHQVRSDRFGLDPKLSNDLAQFYQSICAVYTPATVKVARGKYIERSFGSEWHATLGNYPNYAGHNVSALTKLNQDAREANQHLFPDIAQAPAQAAEFIHVMRHLVNEETGLSRQEQWIKGFHESEKSKAHPITETQLLLKLGTPHPHLNKITSRGLSPAINCRERIYEIPEAYYLQTIGKQVQVIYDPMDYSRILVTDGQSHTFIAREQQLMPSAIADYQPGDRAKINARLEEKQRHMAHIAAKKKERVSVLDRERIDAESLLQAGVHSKALNHMALLDYETVTPVSTSIPKQKRASAKDNESRNVLDQLNDM